MTIPPLAVSNAIPYPAQEERRLPGCPHLSGFLDISQRSPSARGPRSYEARQVIRWRSVLANLKIGAYHTGRDCLGGRPQSNRNPLPWLSLGGLQTRR